MDNKHDLVTHLLQAAQQYNSNCAMMINNVSYSYGDLFGKAAAIMETLDGTESQNIGVFVDDSLETYASLLALLIAGKTYVTLHPSYPENRIHNIVEQADIHTVLSSKPCPFSGDTKWINTTECNAAEQLPERHATADTANAYLIFTSGSTGTPKGVPISRANLNAFYNAYCQLGWKLTENDRMLQMFELSFDVSVVSFFYPLTIGASIFTVGYNDVKYLKVFELIERYQLTFAAVAPSILQMGSRFFSEFQFPQLKYVALTAEASQIDLIEAFRPCAPHAEFINLYGPTEGTIYCTSYKLPATDCKNHNGMVAIGRPFNGITFCIADDEGNELPAGQEGELWISGGQVTAGYWKAPEKTAEAMVNVGGTRFYKTGDRCFVDAEGCIIYCGRKDSQVKVQGYRIELSEIEQVAHKFFADNRTIVAVAVNHASAGCELHLAVEGTDFDASELLQHLQTMLPGYMMPKQIHQLTHIPQNTNNKVDRKKIKERIEDEFREVC